MRRRAEPTAIPAQDDHGTNVKPVRLLLGVACALAGLLILTGSAAAKVIDVHVYDGAYPGGTIDGNDAVGAPPVNEPSNIGVDSETGDVYVGSGGYVYHFSGTGESLPFSAFTPNTVFEQPTYELGSVKVDNSGTATQGRIYAKGESPILYGRLPSGELIGENFPMENLGDGCGLDIAPDGGIWVSAFGGGLYRYDPSGASSGDHVALAEYSCGFAMDSQENFYVPHYGGTTIDKYNRAGELVETSWGGAGMGSENLTVDRTTDHIYVDVGNHVNVFDPSGNLLEAFGYPESVRSYPGLAGSQGIAVNDTSHTVYVGGQSGGVDAFVQTGPVTVPDATSERPGVTETSATLRAAVDPDSANGGTDITECRFEWGTSMEYDHAVSCEHELPIGAQTSVKATITGLSPATAYHFRVSATSANGIPSNGADIEFEPSDPPEISEAALDVFSDGARMSAEINPHGARTTYHIEWGTAPCSANPCVSVPVPDVELKELLGVQVESQVLTELAPATGYYWRAVATNYNSTTYGEDQQFTTFPLTAPSVDTCENALVRQQTGAVLLPECRAYELVSAADTGGYDVESNLYPGQSPLSGYPSATSPARALYTVHFGAIPGVGDPPSFGDDPYVATRSQSGWSSKYVGVPSKGTPDDESFGSSLIGSDSALGTYALGGPNICDPCFSDGSTGIPIRLPNGELVQGMRGSLAVPLPEPTGEIAAYFAGDGSHFVFGSEQKFESAGNLGSVSIYERDLAGAGGLTQVVSTMPNGSTMTGEVAELAVSADGSRVLIGRLAGTDGQGNRYYDLYMHIGANPDSVAVADTPNGVLYNGMTADGNRVFFTTPDSLSGDADASPDLFRADVGPSSAVVSRVSTGTGGSGNGDSCTPTSDWNVVEGGPNCGTVAIAGGAGVASGDGTVYFLSPELLDGPSNGTEGQPNLFVALVGGKPTFVATLGLEDPVVLRGVGQPAVRSSQDFEISEDGEFAAFSSRIPVTGYPTNGHGEVYRIDLSGNGLECASCPSTGARSASDATLPHDGSGLTEDGRVFFTSGDPLNLRDRNGTNTDAYEWNGGEPKLLSTGSSEFDSALLSVSRDGKDAFFFTHDALVAQDHNGNLVKLYDAREGGGLYVGTTFPPCKASDECHGPGTQAPPSPDIGTYKGSGGQATDMQAKKPIRCHARRVMRGGRCVKRHGHGRRHRKHLAGERSHG